MKQKKMNKVEYRNIGSLRSEVAGRIIEGLAIPVESSSALLEGYFYETISRDAINDALIAENDIKVYLNHDYSQGTYARSKFGNGTLVLSIEDDGLHFMFECPKTVQGDALLEGVRRGDYDAISFAFIPDLDTTTMESIGDGLYKRTINKINWLDEISILSCLPAYSDTNVDTRDLKMFEDKEKREAEALKAEIAGKMDAMMEEVDKEVYELSKNLNTKL